MKRLLLLAVLMATLIPVRSQGSWANYYRSNELEINYHAGIECHDLTNGIHKKIVVLQFVNLTNQNLSISFNKQMWYNGRCIGCDNPAEQHFTVTLDPQQSLVGSCEDKQTKSLYIVDKMLNGGNSMLTKFELANIHIATIRQ